MRSPAAGSMDLAGPSSPRPALGWLDAQPMARCGAMVFVRAIKRLGRSSCVAQGDRDEFAVRV